MFERFSSQGKAEGREVNFREELFNDYIFPGLRNLTPFSRLELTRTTIRLCDISRVKLFGIQENFRRFTKQKAQKIPGNEVAVLVVQLHNCRLSEQRYKKKGNSRPSILI